MKEKSKIKDLNDKSCNVETKKISKKEEKKLKRQQKKELKKYRKENNIPTIWKYLKDYKLLIFLYFFFGLLNMVISIAITLLLADMIADVTEKLYRDALIKVVILAVCYVVYRILDVLLNDIYFRFSTKLITRLNNDLAYQAFKLKTATYANNSTGTFVQRIANDPNRLSGLLVQVVDNLSTVLENLIICVYIFFLNYIIGFILLAALIIAFVIDRFRLKLLKKNRKISSDKYDKINSLTTEIVKSERDIKSLGMEEKLKSMTNDYYGDYNKFNYKMYMKNVILSRSREIINLLFSMGALALGIILMERALLVVSSFMIIYSNRSAFQRFVYLINNILDIINEFSVYNERIFALFDNKKFPIETFGTVQLSSVVGEIEFKHVTFAYDDNLGKNEKILISNDFNKNDKNCSDKVLNDLSFKIEPNTTVAFVGKSGGGKSTILGLISKMYEVNEGEVLIDGVNINDLTKESIRNNITLVNQFPYIFDTSIYENLLFAKNDATQEEIDEAIEKSYLKEFVDSLKDGLNTIVGESGIKLSGGQRQRLAIARALLRKSSIILFDESTSSLDNFAQEHIKKSIDSLKGKSTVVIVAHRLSTIKNADKIFFLDEGKIIDCGTFDELFAKNEKFNHMFLAENI